MLSPQSIKSIGEDFDNDGLVDRWNMSMRVKRPQLSASGSGADLRQATIVVGFNYQTQQVVKMQMETLAVVQVGYDLLVGGASTTVSKITAIGSLDLVQQSVIQKQARVRNLYNDALLDSLGQESLSSFLVERYYGGRRNETTDFNYELFLDRGVGGTSDTDYIDIELVINVPPE